MPITYINIASVVLANSTTNLVTFSSIPNTYTDLVLRISTRNTSVGSNQINELAINSTTTNYSQTLAQGSGASAISTRYNTQSSFRLEYTDSSGNTANTFGSGEIYIPNYTSSNNKPASAFQVSENNSSTAYITAHALLWRNSSAINRLDLRPNNWGSEFFASGSSFYLYGIKAN